MDQTERGYFVSRPTAKPISPEEEKRQRAIMVGVTSGVAGILLLGLLVYGGFLLWKRFKNRRQLQK